MSKLKAFELKVGRNLETDSPLVVGVDDKWNSRIMSCEEVYLKSEADKVIAELKAQKAQAEDDYAYWKSKAQRERHHKYKRCLAMAKWCAEMKGKFVKQKWFEKATFWWKWQDKWLEIAEKFK